MAADFRAALLRAPPFPGPVVMLSEPAPFAREGDTERVFAAIRATRVGGTFWQPPAPSGDWRTIVRARSGTDDGRRSDTLRLSPDCETDPWSVLKAGVRLVAEGADEWVALGAIAGCTVEVLSPGPYGTPGMDGAGLRDRAATHLFGASYRDPFTDASTDIEAVIAQLSHWRRIVDANRSIVAACGMTWWKRREIARFLWSPDARLCFFRSERRAIAHAAQRNGAVAVWPSRVSAQMAERAKAQGVPLIRVEDGFVRSIGLGSDLVPPSSVTVDRLGIHYDPGRPSDLERLLAQASFPPAMLRRAERLRVLIVEGRISKYGGDRTHAFPPRQPGRRLVLVPGQVEDDMSVRLGGGGLSSNLELLRRARALEPEAEIWFRPHPDVDAGHRKGIVRDEDALGPADRIVRGGSMADLLDLVDAVQVLTSLTGFEALLRGREVTCHGMPFYAGWGLTRDLMPVSGRRGRPLTLDELVAAVLILYPRYLDPVTGLPCEPETLVARMVAGDASNRLGWVTRLRQWQGRLRTGRR